MAPVDFLITLISSAAVSAALAALLLWLTKSWIAERLKNAIKAEYDTKLESHKAQLKAEYDKQLETHKVQLRSQADIELEKLKSFLAVTAAEQNTTFAKLHDRRIDVIANTYARLRKLHSCVVEYVKVVEMSDERSREERRKDAADAFNELQPYFSQNQIFLPKRIADLIEKANVELLRMTNRFTLMVDIARTPDVNQWMRSRRNWTRSLSKLFLILKTICVKHLEIRANCQLSSGSRRHCARQ
ncbi:MAG: hypothetical protein WA373_02165 [Burkholderiales bacterium]